MLPDEHGRLVVQPALAALVAAQVSTTVTTRANRYRIPKTCLVNAGAFGNLDALAEAITKAETVGATITSYVTNPAVALLLAKVKNASGSNQPLLGMDAPPPPAGALSGFRCVCRSTWPHVAWALDSSRVWLVVREDASVEADRSVFFTSDRFGSRP